MTSRPACASGSAAMPPAAPRPMITTSVSLSLVAIRLRPFPVQASARHVLRRRFGERVGVVRGFAIRLELALLELLLFGGAHHRANAWVGDEIPADEVRVAAVVRIAERALQGVVEHEREECGGSAEAGGR